MATKSAITLYHNPRCSKSRQALELLQGKGVAPEVVEYLKTPPSRTELAAIVKKLGVKPEAIVRTGEEIYKSKYKGKAMTDAQWLDALAADLHALHAFVPAADDMAGAEREVERIVAVLAGIELGAERVTCSRIFRPVEA